MASDNEGATTIICGGEMEIVRLTEEYYEEATEIYMNCFVQNENICISTDIRNNKVAREEIEILFRAILQDNISFGAKHIATNRLGAICMNKILEPKSHSNLEEVFQKFKSPQMEFVGSYLDQMENTYDLYKNLDIDCCMEVVFLSTRPEFERKGLARSLTLYSMHFARNLGSDLFPDKIFPESVQGKRPKAVSSVFTSRFTQLIGEKLGFETVYKVPYTELTFNGYSLASKLDPIHVYSTFAVRRL